MLKWLSHFLFGFPDPYYKAGRCGRYFRLLFQFFVLTVGLAIWDVVSDILFLGAQWRGTFDRQPCSLDIQWLVLITLIPFFPVIASVFKGPFLHRRWTRAATLNWRLARKRLINAEEQLLVNRNGERVNPDKSAPIWSCAKTGLAHRVKYIFPLSFFRRCWSFVSAWKLAADPEVQYSYHKDLEFQDFHLQRAQLTEIKYESCPQLIILLLIMGTAEHYQSYKMWLAAATSFFSIAKYFPSVALLPGKCAFNNKVFGEKDCVETEEANELLKPSFVQWSGALTNFVYIICRYHLIISLAIYNWLALFLAIAAQTVTICAFLIISYLSLSSKYLFREETSCPIRRKIGVTCAFGSQLLTTTGYFLLLPVTTTMTTLGTVLATTLQLIAISAFAIVQLVAHADWTDRKDCRGNFFCSLTPLCPKTSYILLASNVALSIFLPLLQRAITHYTDSGFWLRHRLNCKKCEDFRERYCNQRPCWLCEWTWCDESEKLQHISSMKTDESHSNIKQEYRPSTPVPFLKRSVHSKHSKHILSVLATLVPKTGDDFLLCKYHVKQLQKTELVLSHRKSVLADGYEIQVDETSPLAPFSKADPDTHSLEFDPRGSMNEFLRKLYSLNGLHRKLPHQLFYKSKLYDRGIRDPQDQNKYWMEIKKLRSDHTACGTQCALYNSKSKGSGKLKLVVTPPGMDEYDWRLDTLDVNGKIIQDKWEYDYFNDANVLELDSFDVREPERDCPLKVRKREFGLI